MINGTGTAVLERSVTSLLALSAECKTLHQVVVPFTLFYPVIVLKEVGTERGGQVVGTPYFWAAGPRGWLY